jgi:hypothetical protein
MRGLVISVFRACLGLLVSLLASTVSPAQNGPFSARATAKLAVASPVQQKDREFKVDLIINLNAATGFNGPGSITPAVLGAFLFNVGFSPQDFQFIGAENGTASEFGSTPVFTHPTIANNAGFVGVVNSQTGSTPRSGDYLAAKITLKPTHCFASSFLTPNPNGASNPMNLSSAYLSAPSPAGPALISFLSGPPLALRSIQRGDANGDGIVNAQDVVATIRAIFDAGGRNGMQDCNQSGIYSVADVICTLPLTFTPSPCL